MDVLRHFGALVRNRRAHLKLTQSQLAELSGLHRTYISGVELGDRNVSLRNIVSIAAALDCAPGELLDGIGLIEREV